MPDFTLLDFGQTEKTVSVNFTSKGKSQKSKVIYQARNRSQASP